MSSIDPLFWSIVLLGAGLVLAFLEVFIPSGGILGFLSLTAVVTSVVMAFFFRGMGFGLAFATVAVIAFPAAIALAFKYWPHTAMGRRFLLGLPTDEEVLPDDEMRQANRALVGKFGVAKTPMLPSGAIVVKGRTIDALSQGVPIEPGQTVKVIEVRANRVVVRPADPHETATAEDPSDPLSQSIETLGLDPLDDPLA